MKIEWGDLFKSLLKKEIDAFTVKQEAAFRAFADFSRLSEEDGVFEFGCRKGDFLFHIASKVDFACGMDIAAEDILEAKRVYQSRAAQNLQFVSGQIGNIQLAREAYSVILSRFAVHNIYEYHKVFSELLRLCSANGRLALKDQIVWGHEAYDLFWNDFGRLLDVGHHQFVSREFLVNSLYSMGLEIVEELQIAQWISLRELLFLHPRALSRSQDIQRFLIKNIDSDSFSSDLVKYENDDLHFKIKYYLILGGKKDEV